MKLGLGIGLNRGRRGGGAPGAVGILDSYTGAAFAFAPDTLIYSGFSVTDNTAGSNTNGNSGEFTVLVRRDSDNSLQSFTWEEVGDGTLVTWVGAGNDGFVQVAYDQSGNDNHASQTTAANQPKIVDNGVLLQKNGKLRLDFDGIDDKIILNIEATVVHCFTVSSFLSLSNFNFLLGSTSDRYVINLANVSPQRVRIFAEDTFILGSVIGLDEQHLISGLSNYSNSEIVVDGTINTGALSSQEINRIDIGSRGGVNTNFGHVSVQFIVLYDYSESANRTAIENAINTEYSIY